MSSCRSLYVWVFVFVSTASAIHGYINVTLWLDSVAQLTLQIDWNGIYVSIAALTIVDIVNFTCSLWPTARFISLFSVKTADDNTINRIVSRQITAMFRWITMLMLFGVTLSDIIDAENAIDGCGKDNTTMCGKYSIFHLPTLPWWPLLIVSHFSSSIELRNCDMIHARKESRINFVKLEHIQGSKTAAYKMRLVVFIRGTGNCHIVLSPVEQLNRKKDAFYDIGRLCLNQVLFLPTINIWLHGFFVSFHKCARTTNNNNNNVDDGYDQTVIGGLNNSRTIIRRQTRIVISQSTNNVLSSEEPVEFKIEITSRSCGFLCSDAVIASVCANNIIIYFRYSMSTRRRNQYLSRGTQNRSSIQSKSIGRQLR